MESSSFVLDVLEHCKQVGPENNTVDRKVKLRSDEVVGSDCHKACHELEAWNGWSLKGGEGALRHLPKTKEQCAWPPWLSLSLKYAEVE